MSNTRYINGWECSVCSELYSTERKAKNCFMLCLENELTKECFKIKSPMVKLIVGHECIDCLKLHDKYIDARQCCYRKFPEEKDKDNYNLIKKK